MGKTSIKISIELGNMLIQLLSYFTTCKDKQQLNIQHMHRGLDSQPCKHLLAVRMINSDRALNTSVQT